MVTVWQVLALHGDVAQKFLETNRTTKLSAVNKDGTYAPDKSAGLVLAMPKSLLLQRATFMSHAMVSERQLLGFRHFGSMQSITKSNVELHHE